MEQGLEEPRLQYGKTYELNVISDNDGFPSNPICRGIYVGVSGKRTKYPHTIIYESPKVIRTVMFALDGAEINGFGIKLENRDSFTCSNIRGGSTEEKLAKSIILKFKK